MEDTMELSKEYLALKAAGARKVRGLPKADYMAEDDKLIIGKAAVEAYIASAPGKKVKHVIIEATFPELKGGAMYQSAHGEASGTKPAIARAFRELLKKVPGKRVSVIQARSSITTKTVEE